MSSYGTAPPGVNPQHIPKLNTRKPTGLPSWPLVLVEGGEKVGKTWLAAEFTGSSRIGQAFWLDWNEGAADEYGAVPGASYEPLVHDGSWQSITGQVAAAWMAAAEAERNGQPPVLLVIDTMTAEWNQLKDWGDHKVRTSPSGKRKLQADPGADVPITQNVWADVHDRHYKFMRMLMRFPGVVVMTARGKETVALDGDGRPIEGAKSYKVEGHKNLAFDASAWVRLSRDHKPMVVGARSVHAGIRPGVDDPRTNADLSLDWLVFDVLLGGAAKAGQTRDLVEPQPAADEPPAPVESAQPPQQAETPSFTDVDWDAAVREAAEDAEGLTELLKAARLAGVTGSVMERIADAALIAAGDDTAALTKLWQVANGVGVPGQFMDRVIAAGKAATGADAPAPEGADDSDSDGDGETAAAETPEPSDEPGDHDPTNTPESGDTEGGAS